MHATPAFSSLRVSVVPCLRWREMPRDRAAPRHYTRASPVLPGSQIPTISIVGVVVKHSSKNHQSCMYIQPYRKKKKDSLPDTVT